MKTTILALVATLLSLILLALASWGTLFGQSLMMMAAEDAALLVVYQLILLICLISLLWRARKARKTHV